MISLIFKILGDATGFNRTMTRDLPQAAKKGGETAGKEAGSSFGKEFGSQVKGAIMGVIGVGALASAIKKSVEQAAEIAKSAATTGISVEATQELQRASKLTGLSVEKLREAATKAPEQFAALMRQVQAQGGPTMNEAEVETLTGLRGLFSNIGAGASKLFARGTAGASGMTLDIASRLAETIAVVAETQAQMVGATDWARQNTDQLMRASVMLRGMSERDFERSVGVAQGTATSTPAGDLLRKLEEINNTMKERL